MLFHTEIEYKMMVWGAWVCETWKCEASRTITAFITISFNKFFIRLGQICLKMFNLDHTSMYYVTLVGRYPISIQTVNSFDNFQQKSGLGEDLPKIGSFDPRSRIATTRIYIFWSFRLSVRPLVRA
jgi:hypothetical protein